ncbi:hypothetical protein HT094_22420 [Shewanella sp. ZOR0012]|uniref:hypothetical protein n=1 Tax=Shewanella sp. ZOR0012 TaxID=1339231 RepID=UPI000645ED30|nr:hypothetical protein [Shewanella sp. ZOR0012]NSM26858.1 hypothetical protein [Shewanella sp. ZOR0012]
MKKFLSDSLLMSLGAVIWMIIAAKGKLPTLSFETLLQLLFAVGLGFLIRSIVGKIHRHRSMKGSYE